MIYQRLWAALFALSLTLPALASAQVDGTSPVPEVHVYRTPASSAALDNPQGELAWSKAPVIHLTQNDPHPGAPTPFRTKVQLLANDTHLYFRVTCTDPHPKRLIVHSLVRDSDQRHDDHVTIVLDPFDTHRLGYVFEVNAGGARTDGLMSPASSRPNYDWDGIWTARVERTSTGWVAVIDIDTRSLQFPAGQDRWGMNVQRYVPRKQLSMQWASIALNAKIYDLSRLGILAGMSKMQQGHGLTVSPYVLLQHHSLGNGTSAQVGGNVLYSLTPSIVGILTINPDFAEAEADTQKINLTRFSLFYPEKRKFFSIGSNLFGFAAGLTDNYTFLPFYSRRIGLVDGQTVRVDSGFKMLGTAGPWSIGLLDTRMGRSSASSPTNLFAGRLTYDVNPHLRLGGLLTNGDPTGQTRNQFAGLDAVWHTARFMSNKDLTLSAWAGRSSDPLPGRHSGWGAYAGYPNELWYGYISYNVFGDALDPALGFLPRPGTRQSVFYVDYRPRPTSSWLEWAHQFFYRVKYFQVDDLHGFTQTRRIFTAPFDVETQSGAHYEFSWIPDYEALTAPFDVADGVTIPVGRYQDYRYRLQAESSPARRWRIGSTFETGGFYAGRLTQYMPFVSWNAMQGKLAFELSNETDYGYLPQGDFIRRLYVLQTSFGFSPDLVLSMLAQYDSGVGHIGINTRVKWTIAPGREFFLVLNHGVEASVTSSPAITVPLDNVFIAKLRWDFHG